MKKKFRKCSDIRVGVVGYGGAYNMGRVHLSEMSAAGMTPVAVAEIDPQRRAVASSEFPQVGVYSSVSEMLLSADVDLVTVVTPHNTHAAVALQCLRAGKHVINEKPLALTVRDCDAMTAAARKSGVLLSAYHNRHWDGCILGAVELLRRRKSIGEIYKINAFKGRREKPADWWRSSRSISGGILFDWGIHLVEYALQLIDEEPVEVSGFAHEGYWARKTRWKSDTNEDEGRAVVRFANGTCLTLTISSLDSNPPRGYFEITGTKGSCVWEHDRYTIYRREGPRIEVEEGGHPPSEHANYYKNIAAHLTGKSHLVITPAKARRLVQILELATRSAREGKTLPVR
ncbi:MAG: hypothetical protein RL630_320 [Verrucomicrobiota bacterium]|jgi:scyllo-inositol 2-dehydrogenase (NADP+)